MHTAAAELQSQSGLRSWEISSLPLTFMTTGACGCRLSDRSAGFLLWELTNTWRRALELFPGWTLLESCGRQGIKIQSILNPAVGRECRRERDLLMRSPLACVGEGRGGEAVMEEFVSQYYLVDIDGTLTDYRSDGSFELLHHNFFSFRFSGFGRDGMAGGRPARDRPTCRAPDLLGLFRLYCSFFPPGFGDV